MCTQVQKLECWSEQKQRPHLIHVGRQLAPLLNKYLCLNACCLLRTAPALKTEQHTRDKASRLPWVQCFSWWNDRIHRQCAQLHIDVGPGGKYKVVPGVCWVCAWGLILDRIARDGLPEKQTFE